MKNAFIFDQPHYDALNAARVPLISQLLDSLRQKYQLKSAVDLGCGLGYFSALLRDLEFEVLGVDGRQENLDEAKRRVSGVDFKLADAEDRQVLALGQFDVALCLGLYYHLENPLLAFRNLLALTRKVAIVEGMCVPGNEPILAIRDEGTIEDQGLHYVGLYPSENGLIKLLYRSGFPYLYRFRQIPSHSNYRKTSVSRQIRTIFVAAVVPLESDLLQFVHEPLTNPDPWTIRNSPAGLLLRARNFSRRIWLFIGKPWDEKRMVLRRLWVRRFQRISAGL